MLYNDSAQQPIRAAHVAKNDVGRTSDVKKSLKDGCKAIPRSFFSSPPSHSGHKWVFLSNTHDLGKHRPGRANNDRGNARLVTRSSARLKY